MRSLLGCVVLMSVVGMICIPGVSIAAGSKSYPPINVDGLQISVGNPPATCHVGDSDDRVHLYATGAFDEDVCGQWTDGVYYVWHWSSGSVFINGAHLYWTATEEGNANVSVDVNDYGTGDYDDDPVYNAASKSVTGFTAGAAVMHPEGYYIVFVDGSSTGAPGMGITGQSDAWSQNGTQWMGCSSVDATWVGATRPQCRVKGTISGQGHTECRADMTVSAYDTDANDSGSGDFVYYASGSTAWLNLDWSDDVVARAGATFRFLANQAGVTSDDDYNCPDVFSSAYSPPDTEHANATKSVEFPFSCEVEGDWMGVTSVASKGYAPYIAHSESSVDLECDFWVSNPSYTAP